MNDEKLRRSFSAAATDARPTPACPEPSTLWEARRGDLSASNTRDLVDHTASCPACAEAWRLAGAMDDTAAAPRSGKSWVGLAAAAAVLALALLAVPWLRDPVEPEPPVFRQSEETGVRSLVSDALPLTRDNCLLRWTSPDQGTTYDVYVATQALVVVAVGRDLREPEFLVPFEALADLAPETKLLWHVESVSPDGERDVSKTFVVRLQ